MKNPGARALITGLVWTIAAAGLAGCAGEGAPESDADPAPSTTEAEATTSLLNPNLASEDDLAGVEGLSEDAVAAILDGRPFLDMASLDEALAPHVAMGPRTALYRSVWVPLDLNAASRDEILLIPNLGERMADEFEEYRPYAGMAEFRREMGKYVDDAEVERLAAYVFVPVDLNTATDEEILAIPGVGDRMLGEFKEYRPYADMAEFRREIGKYVDDAELDRLARYVTLRRN